MGHNKIYHDNMELKDLYQLLPDKRRFARPWCSQHQNVWVLHSVSTPLVPGLPWRRIGCSLPTQVYIFPNIPFPPLLKLIFSWSFLAVHLQNTCHILWLHLRRNPIFFSFFNLYLFPPFFFSFLTFRTPPPPSRFPGGGVATFWKYVSLPNYSSFTSFQGRGPSNIILYFMTQNKLKDNIQQNICNFFRALSVLWVDEKLCFWRLKLEIIYNTEHILLDLGQRELYRKLSRPEKNKDNLSTKQRQNDKPTKIHRIK